MSLTRPAPREISSASLVAAQRDLEQRMLDSVNGEDIVNELRDHEDALTDLLQAGDALAIGRFVLAIKRAYALRCAATPGPLSVRLQSEEM